MADRVTAADADSFAGFLWAHLAEDVDDVQRVDVDAWSLQRVLEQLDVLADACDHAERAARSTVDVATVRAALDEVLRTPAFARPLTHAEHLLARHAQAVVPGEQQVIRDVRLAADAEHLARADEQTMTLGELLDVLSGFEPDRRVVYAGESFEGEQPSSIDSWRGIYADLALSHEPPRARGPVATVDSLLEVLRDAVGSTFTGWKGGDYTMTERTPVWVDNPGDWSEVGISGVNLDADQECVVLRLRSYR